MKRVSFDDMSCSIARSLDVVGEWWTPLIVREVFFGHRRFEEIRASLGISRNILTDRLNRLVEEGILVRHDIGQVGTRHEYRLTDKGIDLHGVLVALMQWGDRWMPDPKGPPTQLVHLPCGEVTHPVMTCDHCGEEVTARSVRAVRGPGWIDVADHPLPPPPSRSEPAAP